MVFGLFKQKKVISKLREDVQDSFDHVKKDFNKVGEWIKHLDEKHVSHVYDIADIKSQILAIQGDLIEIKDFISFFGPQVSGNVSKQSSTSATKQTLPDVVQTSVQTGVQSDILENLTVMERAIVWALLNSELKLSYEDLAMVLGKDKSTVRGQINTIKQKEGNIIMETREANGKKRLYIPEEIKMTIMKGVKIKVDKGNVWKSRKSES
jgi:predicted transcriptional regulator